MSEKKGSVKLNDLAESVFLFKKYGKMCVMKLEREHYDTEITVTGDN